MKISERFRDVAVVGCLMILFSGMVAVLYESPWLLFFLTLPIPFVLISRFENIQRAAKVALVGMVLGPITEIICVAAGLWTYFETGGFPYIPVWLFAGWACFPTALILLTKSVLNRSISAQSMKGITVFSVFGITLQVVLFVLFGHSSMGGLIVAGSMIIAVILLLRKKETYILLLLGAFIGPLVEAIPIVAGAWSYPIVEILSMPYYMPLAYGIFAVFVSYIASSVSFIKY